MNLPKRLQKKLKDITQDRGEGINTKLVLKYPFSLVEKFIFS
jgi:hypothetical protein